MKSQNPETYQHPSESPVDLSGREGAEPDDDESPVALLHLAVVEDYLECTCDEECEDIPGGCTGNCECLYGRSLRALRKAGYEV